MFNLQAIFLLGFLINFASGLLWQRHGHPILVVAQESKLCSGKSKTSNILTIACVEALGHNFFQIISYLVGMGRYEKYVDRDVANAKPYRIRDSAF